MNMVDKVRIPLATADDPLRVGCVDNSKARIMRLVHISDTHLTHNSIAIPAGDILVHSGDFFDYSTPGTFLDDIAELDKFFASQMHRYKIFVAGNHELSLYGQPIDRIRARLTNALYLQDNSVLIEGLNIYGSPWSGKRKSPASAYISPYPELGKYWVMIPKETDILITHSPPHRILDNHGGMGCPLLREIVLKQIRPIVHLFGHAHQGSEVIEKQGVLFSNGAQYGVEDTHPIVIDLYLPPDLPSKTKLYKQPMWREEHSAIDAKSENKEIRCLLM